MVPAYKQLEAKTRIADLTLGQWVGVVAGVLCALVVIAWLKPFGTYANLVLGVYLGGHPGDDRARRVGRGVRRLAAGPGGVALVAGRWPLRRRPGKHSAWLSDHGAESAGRQHRSDWRSNSSNCGRALRTGGRRGPETPSDAPAGAPAREAGELLALEELDQTGLAITSEGALVRVLEVTPRNPLIMADAERAQLAHGFRDVLSKLRPGQTLQFYVETAPVDLASLLEAGPRAGASLRRRSAARRRGQRRSPGARAVAAVRGARGLAAPSCRHQAAVRTRMLRGRAVSAAACARCASALGQLRSGGSLPRGPLQRELGRTAGWCASRSPTPTRSAPSCPRSGSRTGC